MGMYKVRHHAKTQSLGCQRAGAMASGSSPPQHHPLQRHSDRACASPLGALVPRIGHCCKLQPNSGWHGQPPTSSMSMWSHNTPREVFRQILSKRSADGCRRGLNSRPEARLVACRHQARAGARAPHVTPKTTRRAAAPHLTPKPTRALDAANHAAGRRSRPDAANRAKSGQPARMRLGTLRSKARVR